MAAGESTYKPPLTTSRPEFLNDGSDAEFREAIYTIVLSVDRLLKCRNAFADILGLTSSQFAVMMGVASRQRSKGVTIKELAEHVSLAPTHVTTEIGRLESKGLLVKRDNEADRRSVLVFLSSSGEAAISRIAPIVRDVNDLLFRHIDARSFDNAQKTARRIVYNSDDALVLLRKQRAIERGQARGAQPSQATKGRPTKR